jgi:replicative DNA helicase
MDSNPIFYHEEAEKAVIGSILLESKAISLIDFLVSEMFYNDRNKTIYNAVKTLYDNGKSIDVISISEYLKSKKELDFVGGSYALMELQTSISSTVNIENYARLIQQEFYRKQFYLIGEKIKTLSSDKTQDIEDVFNTIDLDVRNLSSQIYRLNNNVSLEEAAYKSFQDYFLREKLYRDGKVLGISTGLSELDKISAGWQKSELIILAARPAMGKTSVMLHMAKTASKEGKKVMIFSLEMSVTSLANKLILSEGEIDASRFKTGTLSQLEVVNLENATGSIYKLSMTINDQGGMNVRQMRNIALQLKKAGKLDVLFIDYLQLMDMKNDNKSYNREQEVSQTSRALKLLAKELDIPIIALSQLSRACEERKDKRPLLSDLRESGAIEQDADVVIFLWRPEYYDIEFYENESSSGLIVADIAKGREMPTGEVKFHYNKQFTKFWTDDNNAF